MASHKIDGNLEWGWTEEEELERKGDGRRGGDEEMED